MRKEQIRREVAARMLAYSARAHYRGRRRVIEERRKEDHREARDIVGLHKLGLDRGQEREENPSTTRTP